VSPEVRDPSPIKGSNPDFPMEVHHRIPVEAEHVRQMPPELPPDDRHGLRIERDRNGLPGLGLIGMNQASRRTRSTCVHKGPVTLAWRSPVWRLKSTMSPRYSGSSDRSLPASSGVRKRARRVGSFNIRT
jgi:hypothetical protein